MDTLIGTLKDAGLCKDVHYKELYIPQAELEGIVLHAVKSCLQMTSSISMYRKCA